MIVVYTIKVYTFWYTYDIIKKQFVNEEVFDMENKVFGYVRVSSKEQKLDLQIDNLRHYVTDESDIIIDKQFGKDTNRPGLQNLLYNLRNGDTVYINSLDRLGRNKNDIKQLLCELKNKGATVRILNLPASMVDYGESNKGIMEIINNIIIEVMTHQAQVEMENIRKRQKEGIAAAKIRGVHFGRIKYEFPASWKEDYKVWKNKGCTAKSLMKKYNWSSTTFYRKVNEYEHI